MTFGERQGDLDGFANHSQRSIHTRQCPSEAAAKLTFRSERHKFFVFSIARHQKPLDAMKPPVFFASHPIFTVEEARKTLHPEGGRRATSSLLQYYVRTRRLTSVTHGVYAVVPPGVSPDQLRVDPFLAAAALRPDGVFSYHSALELLGAAHSVWRRCTLFTSRRRSSLLLPGVEVVFAGFPAPFRNEQSQRLGTQRVERLGAMLVTTGPERTLVDGLRSPAAVGGLEELEQSASGFPALDMELLEKVLKRYDLATLWAAAGWFLERYHTTFHPPEKLLGRCERNRPASPHYLARRERGGTLAKRWNLYLPAAITEGEPDER
jgi:predicted transcriptional regulator of viral defense system